MDPLRALTAVSIVLAGALWPAAIVVPPSPATCTRSVVPSIDLDLLLQKARALMATCVYPGGCHFAMPLGPPSLDPQLRVVCVDRAHVLAGSLVRRDELSYGTQPDDVMVLLLAEGHGEWTARGVMGPGVSLTCVRPGIWLVSQPTWKGSCARCDARLRSEEEWTRRLLNSSDLSGSPSR